MTSSVKYPPIDHTLGTADGHYIRANSQKEVVIAYTIPAEVTDAVQPMCMKFWYYFGSPLGIKPTKDDYISISTTRVESLHRITGDTITSFDNENQWLYGRVSFSLNVKEMVAIRAYISYASFIASSLIALDDIQIQKQFCEQPGWCDFENGEIH